MIRHRGRDNSVDQRKKCNLQEIDLTNATERLEELEVELICRLIKALEVDCHSSDRSWSRSILKSATGRGLRNDPNSSN